MKNSMVLAGSSVPNLSVRIADLLGLTLVHADIGRFYDGEVRVQIKDEVRGKNIIFIQSFSKQVNDMLVEVVIAVDALKRAGATSITLVCPYLAYMRQDRKDRKGAPISAQVVANILSNSPINHLIAIDLHAKQNQGFFQTLMDELYAGDVFLSYIRTIIESQPTVLIAPDAGALKNIRRYAELLHVPYALIEKERLNSTMVEARNLYGNTEGMQAIIIDDLCLSGSTLMEAAKLLKHHKATNVKAFVSHGLFTAQAVRMIEDNIYLDKLYCTDSVDNTALLQNATKFVTISLAEYIANSLLAMYEHGQLQSQFA